jgi:hypothetical protein
MTIEIYIGLLITIGIFGGYTNSFQRATLYWGKAIAKDNEGRGFQDAITPSIQKIRIMIYYTLAVVSTMIGFVFFKWYIGVIAFIVIHPFLGSAFKRLFPKEDSDYHKNYLIKDLERRNNLYLKNGDSLKAEAANHMANLLKGEEVHSENGDSYNPVNLAKEIFAIYKRNYTPSLTEKEIARQILIDRYSKTQYQELAQSNVDFVDDIQMLTYCILNMEFPGGRDQEKLAKMYLASLIALKNLGHIEAIEEFKKLETLAKGRGIDEKAMMLISIKTGMIHKRSDLFIIDNLKK